MPSTLGRIVDKDLIFEAYVSGNVSVASTLESNRFNLNHPDVYLAMNSELSRYNLENIHSNLHEMVEFLMLSLQAGVEINSRIKSPSSVYYSLTRTNSDELTVSEIRDLIAFRLLVDSANFDEFYDSSVDVLVQLIPMLADRGYLLDVQIHNSIDHPMQQVHLRCKVDGVFVEIKLMNHYYYSVFERTLYPLWEGFMKSKFSTKGMKNIFHDRDSIWGITCSAFHDKSGDLMTLEHRCQCEGLSCHIRGNMTEHRYRVFFDHIDSICKEVGIDVSEKR